MSATLRRPRINVRYMSSPDYGATVEILSRTVDPWDRNYLVVHMRTANVLGMVATLDERVVGAAVYQLFKRRTRILHLAVAEPARNLGVGTAMIEKFYAKLSTKRPRLEWSIPDTATDAHLFCRAVNLRAVKVERGKCLADRDHYLFRADFEPFCLDDPRERGEYAEAIEDLCDLED